MGTENDKPSKIFADLEAFKLNWKPQRPVAVVDNTRVAPPKILIGDPKIYPIKNGETSDRVKELRIRLAGFGPLKPGSTFDDATEKSVKLFETDVMGKTDPTGIVDVAFAKRLDLFATEWVINIKEIACPCGKCGGFGDGENYGIYHKGKRKLEKYHKYEYPGIHRSLLWGARALMFYCTIDQMDAIRFKKFECGYRCRIDNKNKGRSTTNHMGKAVDMHFETYVDGNWQRDTLDAGTNYKSCNKVRDIAVARMNASVSWAPSGEFGLEPSGPAPKPKVKTKPGDAPTWVHMDVREWELKLLDESYFAKSIADLDGESMETLLCIPVASQLFGGDE